jgi:hypothetical protein
MAGTAELGQTNYCLIRASTLTADMLMRYHQKTWSNLDVCTIELTRSHVGWDSHELAVLMEIAAYGICSSRLVARLRS